MAHTIYSLVVDNEPRLAYQAWHLARSLVEQCGADPATIHIQCTPEVDQRIRSIFRAQNHCVHEISRFGDGRHCNKLRQLDQLKELSFECAVLLDTDMLALGDLQPFLSRRAIAAKIVDYGNPPLVALEEITAAAGLFDLPPLCRTDAADSETFVGNCNGGFYAIPKNFCEELSPAWQRWALWLLDHIELLRRFKKQTHIDQVSFFLAIQSTGLPLELAPSNVNYYIHFTGAHTYYDESREIALLHYHHKSLNVVGLIEPPAKLTTKERAAVARANEQIGRNFNNRLFWDMRYRHFPKRGSGLGSRGANLLYKRALVRAQGIEQAASVLDVGCGDLEVVKDLRIDKYTGIDQSPVSVQLASGIRPDWDFHLGLRSNIPAADFVICFEVLIHQETIGAYRQLIDFLAQKTLRTLLVSGYAAQSGDIRSNPMLFFHEPLELSLRRTARFSRIKQIGAHSDVLVYRCDL